MYDLVIIGGGPAGLTAAIYAIRKRLNVFLVSHDLGGKTNYRLDLPDIETHQVIRGVDVVEKFWRELDYLEFARRLERVAKVTKEGDVFSVATSNWETLQARSVILATGSRVRHLGIPGEDEFVGRGVTYSALSYAPLFLGRTAAVVGDGDRALRAVTELAVVAKSVHLVAHTARPLETPLVRRLATKMQVVVWEGYFAKEIFGDEYARQLVIETAEGARSELEVDGVFVETGLTPNAEPVQDLVELDEKGRVIVDNVNRTSCPGLFAAGDVTNAFAEQVLIAVGEGAKAALSVYDYLLPNL
ncbi:MAG: FAD-dependent oxidoreductase [Chloroflexota bacterium]|nr:MAG: FAD-dependent oxidoreductase [Chloroflexota bacterium]